VAFNRHPEGRQPIGVAQQPFPCYDYPLVAPVSADIQYLLADLKLVYDDPGMYSDDVDTFKLPFRIDLLRGLGSIVSSPIPEGQPIPRADCRIVDADDRTVLDTAVSVHASYALAGRLRLFIWQSERNSLYIVAHTHWSDEGTFPPAQDYAFELVPERAILDARTVIGAPRVVRSLSALSFSGITGDFHFAAGYNYLIDVESETTALRQRNRLIMSAIPGAGEGVFQDCEQAGSAIHTIGGVVPTADGKFFLQADDCTWIRQPIIEIEDDRLLRPHSLQIGDNCKPCCDCIDYARTAINLYRLQQKYKGIGNALNDVRDSYHRARRKWADRKALRPAYDIELRLIPQFCPQLDIYVQINNATSEPINGATFALTLEADGVSIANPPEIVGSYLQMFIRPTPTEPPRYLPNNFHGTTSTIPGTAHGSWPTYVFDIVYIGPRESAHAKFRLQFQDCSPKSVTGSLQANVNGFPVAFENGSPIVREQTVYLCGAEPPEAEEE